MEQPGKKALVKHKFEVDYNDHFETPKSAYLDIMPLLSCVQFSKATMGQGQDQNPKRDVRQFRQQAKQAKPARPGMGAAIASVSSPRQRAWSP